MKYMNTPKYDEPMPPYLGVFRIGSKKWQPHEFLAKFLAFADFWRRLKFARLFLQNGEFSPHLRFGGASAAPLHSKVPFFTGRCPLRVYFLVLDPEIITVKEIRFVILPIPDVQFYVVIRIERNFVRHDIISAVFSVRLLDDTAGTAQEISVLGNILLFKEIRRERCFPAPVSPMMNVKLILEYFSETP